MSGPPVNVNVALLAFVGVLGFDVIVGAVTATAADGIARRSNATAASANTPRR